MLNQKGWHRLLNAPNLSNPLKEPTSDPPSMLHNDSPERIEGRIGESSSLAADASKQPICKCPTIGRKLVVCIDGTSNQFGSNNTNVIELYSQIIKSKDQLTYYNSGIGTYAKPSWKSWSYRKQAFYNLMDLAIAWNFEKIVMAAYHWLSENYEENDRIFLFGFSRGAYQVRVLAGMIKKVGLIHKGNADQIPFAYELYADHTSEKFFEPVSKTLWEYLLFWRHAANTTEPKPINLAQRFKEAFSRDLTVHFVGVWDTVSSVGVIRDKNLPWTDKTEHICFFRHALALDECRVKFLPEYVRVGEGPPQQQTSTSPLPHIKEVWFPGTHSDIGGGNRSNPNLDLGRPPCLWMIYEAASSGLDLKPRKVEWHFNTLGDVKKSLTPGWLIFGYFPFKRLLYDKDKITYRPHQCRGRKIKPGQKIHASVAFCKEIDAKKKTGYQPQALLPEAPSTIPTDWREIVGTGKQEDMSWASNGIFEMDIFDHSAANDIINNLSSSPAAWLYRLKVLTWTYEGCVALMKVENAIPTIAKLLESLDNSGQRDIIEILDGLQDKGSLTLLPKESITFFIAAMDHQKQNQVRIGALKLLSELALDNESREQLCNKGTIEALANLLQEQDDQVIGETLLALWRLARYRDLHAWLFVAEIIDSIWHWVGNKNEVGRRALKVLPFAARQDDIHKREFDTETISAVKTWLKADEPTIALNMIAIAMTYDGLKPIFASTTSFLKSNLSQANASVRLATMKILGLVVKDRISNSTNLISVIQSGLCDSAWPVQLETLRTLGLVAQDNSLFKHICESSDDTIISAIENRLNDRNEDIRQEAQIILGSLVKSYVNHGHSQITSDTGRLSSIQHRLFNEQLIPEQVSFSGSDTPARLSLFALVIGINRYQDPEIPNIRGAIPDANSVKAYLHQHLGVPEAQIIQLIDNTATYEGIINGFSFLSSNTNIKPGDPILIYYAGQACLVKQHGAASSTYILLPYDAKKSEGQVINATQLSMLLDTLVCQKGNNITVVLDCCKAASSSFEAGCLHRDPHSYVLLAACGSQEDAMETKEEDGLQHGSFTTALLKTLKDTSINRLTYTGLMHRMPQLMRQNPQCEGRYKNRVLFNAQIQGGQRSCIRIRSGPTGYTLEAGDAQGIIKGSVFTVYNDDIGDISLGTMRVVTTSALRAHLESCDDLAPVTLPDPAYALELRCGPSSELPVYFTDTLLGEVGGVDKILRPNATHSDIGFRVVERDSAQLVVDVVNEGTSIAAGFSNPHGLAKKYGPEWLPHTVPVAAESISRVLRSVAHWNRHVSREGSGRVSSRVRLEVTRVEPQTTLFDGEPIPVMAPVKDSDMEMDNGIVTVTDTNHLFGVRIINETSRDLFPYLFYFDSNDQSIEPYYLGSCPSDRGDPPLRAHSSLTVGYGAIHESPFAFKLRDNEESDITILKVFLTSLPTDFGSLEQVSPFIAVHGRISQREGVKNMDTPLDIVKCLNVPHGTVSSTTDRRIPHNPMGHLNQHRGMRPSIGLTIPEIWDTLTVAFLQRREPSSPLSER